MKVIAPIGLLLGLGVSCAVMARDFPDDLLAATPSGLPGAEPAAALPALPGNPLDRVLPRGRDAAAGVLPATAPTADAAAAIAAGNAADREPPGTPRALLHDHAGVPGAPAPARKPRAVLSWQSLLPGSIQ